MNKEYSFLKEVDSCALRCAIFNLEDAYKDFFAKRSNEPIFKNKYSSQSYRTNCIRSCYKEKEYSNIQIDLKKKEIKLPKVGIIKIAGYRKLKEFNKKIINATVVKETTGKYYVSVVVEEQEEVKSKVIPKSIVGIDVGIKNHVITSNGEVFENPSYLEKREKQLKRLQKKLSRQIKGSNNYNKTKRKIAVIHSKIKNSRIHHILDIANKLVEENDIIVSEKLNVKGMIQNHKLAKRIMDATFSKICETIKWKCKVHGKYYYQVDTYFPSSKTCNHCGYISKITNDLTIREWECPKCHYELDRDINASINIMYEGIRLHYAK